MASFSDRIDELIKQTGTGQLQGQVEFDQAYAATQHEGGWISGPNAGRLITEHPGGGGSHYLSQPLLDGVTDSMQKLADHLLDDRSGALVEAMIDDVEKLADDSAAKAPIEFGDLRESAHPTVTDDGEVVYDRPPQVPRLSEEQLEAKARGAGRGDYRRTYLPEDHPLHGTLHEVHGGTHSHTKAPKPSPSVDPRST